MLSQDYLCLRLVRLKPFESWTHDGTELGFVFPRGGAGTLVPPSNGTPLMPGEVLVLNGALPSQISASSGKEMAFWFFSAKVDYLFPLFGCNELCRFHAIAETFKSPRHYGTSEPLALECHRLLSDIAPSFDLTHRVQLLRVVAAILSAEFNKVRFKGEGLFGAEARISHVFEKLSISEVLNFSVGELADRFSCSRRHLNRLFHQHLGFSVAALRMEMRLIKAVSLLRDPNRKVITVAEECGFNHLGLFNACFKRRFGASPGQWRKSLQSVQRVAGGFVGGSPSCRVHANGLCPWAIKSGSRPDNSEGREISDSFQSHAMPSVAPSRLKLRINLDT